MRNKTSDKNVENVEDDVKRCNELIKVEHANWIGISNQLAISHILAELEQMLKEREKYTIHLTDEEYRKVIANAQKNVANDSVIAHKFAVMQQQLEQKEKRIQELEEENTILKKASNIAKEVNIEDITDVINESCKEFMSNYIPKQAVIDKIKELDIAILECEYDDDDVEEYKNDVEKEKRILLIKKSALEELLEEK